MLKGPGFLNPADFFAVGENFFQRLMAVLRHPISGGFTSWEAIFCTLCTIPGAKGYMKKQYLLYIGLSGRDLNRENCDF